MHKKCIALKITIIKIITVYSKYCLMKHWLASSVLHCKLLSLFILRLPKLLTLFSAVPPTLCNPQILPSHLHTTSTAVDTLTAKSWTSLGLNLSLLCSCIQLTRCLNHRVSPRFFLTFSLAVCFQNITTCFLCSFPLSVCFCFSYLTVTITALSFLYVTICKPLRKFLFSCYFL